MEHTVISSGIFYKGVTEDLRSPMQSHGLTYTPGTTVKANGIDLDPTLDCGQGINFCRTLADALKWAKKGTVVSVRVPVGVTIVDTGNKLRAERVEVIEKINLSRANLYGANLYGANLSGANLSRANLSGANLYGANLSRANLSRANLYGANLSGANLSGAYLSRANLYGANLYGANLSRANLYGANLSGANLSGAYLSRANLYGANLYGANLSRANLSGAYGTPLSGAPAGWKLNESGLMVKGNQ